MYAKLAILDLLAKNLALNFYKRIEFGKNQDNDAGQHPSHVDD